MLAIHCKKEKKKIIHDIYEDLLEDPKSKAMKPHRIRIPHTTKSVIDFLGIIF